MATTSGEDDFEVINTPSEATSLRSRKKSTAETMVKGGLDSIAKLAPTEYAEYVTKLKPVVEPVFDVLYAILPYFALAGTKMNVAWEMAQPYHPEELGTALLGLLMVFFGGTYLTTIAAFEAFRQCGWERTERHLRILFQNYAKAKIAFAKDDEEDADGDGVPDVLQISSNELYRRKALLIAKSVEPDDVSNAMAGIWSGVFGVVCVLRIQFAAAVTLGAAIGDVLHKGVHQYLQPTLSDMVPQEHNYLKKWVPTVVKYLCRSFAVTIAWLLQRVISAFHSAIRGSEMAIKGITLYLKRHGHIQAVPVEGSQLWFVLNICLAFVGFMWQIRSGFALSFPWNLLFFPITIVEWILVNIVGSNL